jgi:DNA-binding MarR family transcriptional regulator
MSRLLWQTENAVDQALDAVMAQVGLTTTLQGTLRLVATNPGQSAAELARRTLVRPQSIAHATARLEQLGLVTRSPHPVHGRIQKIEVTQAGQHLLKKVDLLLNEAEARLCADLTTAERNELMTCLSRIRDRAIQLHKPPSKH